MKLSLQRPCDNWGGAWRAYVWGNLYLMFVGYNEFTLRPNCRQYGYLSFSLNVTAWEIFTFGVVAISMSCYCFIVLSLSLFIVDSKWVISLFQLVGLWLTLIYIGRRLRRQGQRDMGQGWPWWAMRIELRMSHAPVCYGLLGRSPVIILYGMSLTPLIWVLVERARSVTLNMLGARQ